MSVTDSETCETITVALEAIGCEHVPSTATVDIKRLTVDVVHLEHNGLTYVLEGRGSSVELTSVFGEDDRELEPPRRVPGWIEGVAELVGIEEVELGR